MPKFKLSVSTTVKRSSRTAQLEGMFDVPLTKELSRTWEVDIPIEKLDWSVGLIVGPSGCGKSLIAKRMFGDLVDVPLTWPRKAVVDAFDRKLSMEQIALACSAVGFNTITSWMKPFAVLSNGEQFRVAMARRLLEGGALVVVDEFTSVVDRQVAKIASHAVQKFVRRSEKKQRFVALSCHYDIIEWLRPDWIYDPSKRKFARGCLQQRPKIRVTVGPVVYAAWQMFAPYHYLTAELHRAARCWGLWVDGVMATFIGCLTRPLKKTGQQRNPYGIMGCSRVVTLPDFQGLGLAFVLSDFVGSVYTALRKQVHIYPAHPSLVRGFDRSPLWSLRKRPGVFSARKGIRSHFVRQGGRPCAVFRYQGPAMSRSAALRLLTFWDSPDG